MMAHTQAMHADEFAIDIDLVHSLLAAQHPQWAHLPLRAVTSAGTDNALFRLGETMVVRMPRIAAAAPLIEKEWRHLPSFSALPLQVPEPLAIGAPGCGFAWPWSVYRWLEGDPVSTQCVAQSEQAAQALAGFILALRKIEIRGAPLSGAQNNGRGVPLGRRNHLTLTAIDTLSDEFDAREILGAWRACCAAPPWTAQPVWLHGDIHAGNLLARDNRITAVIDFGLCGVGDPACDLMVAWSLFEGNARRSFRDALGDDEPTWVRGQGWALSVALIALAYYRASNQTLSDMSRRAINAVLTDFREGGGA